MEQILVPFAGDRIMSGTA